MSRDRQDLSAPPRDERGRGGALCVVITGFMGAGKTTVGRELARRLACAFLDLDDLITAREGRTPQQLIDERGEPAFRDAETHALREALENSEAFVVALGGGAWTLERNRALVRHRGALTVWLDAPFELCWQRVGGENNSRPLAREHAPAHSLYEERRESYSLAELRVTVSAGRTAADLAAEIAAAVAET